MARKRSSALVKTLPLVAMLSLIGLVLLLVILAIHPLFLLFIGGLVFVVVFVHRQRTSAKRRLAWQKATRVISCHLDHLTRKRAQLIRQDGYGKPIVDRWRKEVEYFIDQHICLVLSPPEQQMIGRRREQLVGLIEQRTSIQMLRAPVFKEFSDRMTPPEFEAFCAEQLRLAGWSAQITTQSRDQGVDVIAEKAGKRVVLQCKLYSGRVGNGAVQEIAAGRAHERAHYAAVVTNSRYTAPAEQLAATNGILLLHYRDLCKLDELLTAAAVSTLT